MSAVDFIQVLRECVVSALDTAPLVVAATGRANGNLVAWGALEADAFPVAAYRISASPSGGIGDERRVQIAFRAVAATEAQANELLGAIERSLSYPRLHAAVPSVDAYRLYGDEQRTPADYDEEVEAFAGDFDAVLIASNPTP